MVFVAPSKDVQKLLDEHKLNLKRVRVKGFMTDITEGLELFAPVQIKERF